MPKRLLALLVVLVSVVGAISCDRAKRPFDEPPQAQSVPPAPDASLFDLYRSVLQGKARFHSIDADMDLELGQLGQAVSSDSSVSAVATRFAVVDLDSDGEPEIVLSLKVNENEALGSEILRHKDGVVFGHTLWYRAFMDLKTDGTFSFSSGAADHGFAAISFLERACAMDRTTYCESSSDSDGNQVVSFVVDHKKTTETDFLSAIELQNEKAGVVWHDLTDDNVETILANP